MTSVTGDKQVIRLLDQTQLNTLYVLSTWSWTNSTLCRFVLLCWARLFRNRTGIPRTERFAVAWIFSFHRILGSQRNFDRYDCLPLVSPTRDSKTEIRYCQLNVAYCFDCTAVHALKCILGVFSFGSRRRNKEWQNNCVAGIDLCGSIFVVSHLFHHGGFAILVCIAFPAWQPIGLL